jgi:hypothetical protein
MPSETTWTTRITESPAAVSIAPGKTRGPNGKAGHELYIENSR